MTNDRPSWRKRYYDSERQPEQPQESREDSPKKKRNWSGWIVGILIILIVRGIVYHQTHQNDYNEAIKNSEKLSKSIAWSFNACYQRNMCGNVSDYSNITYFRNCQNNCASTGNKIKPSDLDKCVYDSTKGYWVDVNTKQNSTICTIVYVNGTSSILELKTGQYYLYTDENKAILGKCTSHIEQLDTGVDLVYTYYDSNGNRIGSCSYYNGPGASGGCSPKTLEENITDYPYRREKYQCEIK